MADEWKLCLGWLVRCQIVPDNHPVTAPTAQVFDLAQSLRDGVWLCHLLNRLSPGVIDAKDYSQRPQMSQFLCKKNIRIFNQICGSHFGLKQTDLFATDDLFDMRNFAKVVEALSLLSQTSIALKQVTPGFSTKVQRNREDIYADLSSLASDKDMGEDYYSYDSIYGDREEKIYDQMMNLRQKPSAAEQPGPEPKTKRDYCLRELIDTEANYVEALNMITQFFIIPLRQHLDPRDHQLIFACIERLHEIHKGFQVEVLKAIGSGHGSGSSQTTLADCFVKYKERFLIYGDFCSNLPVAQDTIESLCQTNERIQMSVRECEQRANNGKFHIRDLLSVPMQRVLKYALLLKELIKNTDESHPDKKTLPLALAEMQDLSMYINEVKRDNEMIQNLRNIQSCIVNLQMPDNTTLQDYGRLQLDGELKAKSHEDNKYKTRYVFLFDKVMLLCKMRTVDKFLWGDTYSYKDALILAQYRLEDGRNLPKSKEQPCVFQLVQTDENNVVTLLAKTPDLRRKWMEAITMGMENTQPAGAKGPKHDFVMQSFLSATVCDVCKKLLRGVIFQGYKCSRPGCEVKVHKECIEKAKDFDATIAVSPPPKPPPIVHRMSSAAHSPAPERPERPDRPPVAGRSIAVKYLSKAPYNGNPPPDHGRMALTFDMGVTIELVNSDDPVWWEGRLNGHRGFFPSSLVESSRVSRGSVAAADRGSHVTARRLQSQVVREMPSVPNDPTDFLRSHSIHTSTPTNDITKFSWYVGKMNRDEAEMNLEKHVVGTYLIRQSTTSGRQGEYALSVRASVGVRHIRIQRSPDGSYYLADCRHFNSVIELVEYYQKFSLKYSFPEVDNCLTLPYKDAVSNSGGGGGGSTVKAIGYCSVLFDYAATQSSQLSIHVGDRIKITSKGQGGWWKGELNGRTGYFPSTFVIEEEDR